MTTGKMIKTVAATCLTLMGSVVFAAAGDFDPSFNGVGFTRNFIPDFSGSSGVAIHSTGEIVTSGFYYDRSTNTEYLVVWRHLPDGSLDATFGNNGVAYPTPSPAGLFGFDTALAIDNQDRIVLVAAGSNSHVVYRLNFDGSPDLGFSKTGSMTVPLGDGIFSVHGAAIQADNKIVAVSGSGSIPTQFVVYRVQEGGGLDSDFGGTGIVYTQITPGGGVDRATGVAIQSDGNIVVAGRARSLTAGSFFKFALVRYSPAGVLDDSFGDGGKVVFPFLDNSYGRRAVIQPDGKIVIAGTACVGPTDAYCYLAAARVDQAGVFDPGFGDGGKLYTDVGNQGGSSFDVALQPDGRILVAGAHQWTADRTEGNAILIRYWPDGALDSAFGLSGISETNYGYVQNEISTVRVQADGQIVVSAYTGFTGEIVTFSAVTARYLGSDGTFVGSAGSGTPQLLKAPQVER